MTDLTFKVRVWTNVQHMNQSVIMEKMEKALYDMIIEASKDYIWNFEILEVKKT